CRRTHDLSGVVACYFSRFAPAGVPRGCVARHSREGKCRSCHAARCPVSERTSVFRTGQVTSISGNSSGGGDYPQRRHCPDRANRAAAIAPQKEIEAKKKMARGLIEPWFGSRETYFQSTIGGKRALAKTR